MCVRACVGLNRLRDEIISKLGSILAHGQATRPNLIDITIRLSCKLKYLSVNQPICMASGFDVCVCARTRKVHMGFQACGRVGG